MIISPSGTKLIRKAAWLIFISCVFYFIALSYPSSTLPSGNNFADIKIDTIKSSKTVDENYLSFSLDVSRILCGNWWDKPAETQTDKGDNSCASLDFSNQDFIAYTQALSPAYLRIGGTEADKMIFYDTISGKPDINDAIFLLGETWNQIGNFADSTGSSIFLTVGGGPLMRNEKGVWQPDNLEKILRYSRERNIKIDAMELGNEVNAYWYFFGIKNSVPANRLANDFKIFRTVAKKYYPAAKLGGVAAIYWPKIGEVPSLRGKTESSFMRLSGNDADMFTWHYYPQQSERCLLALRRAKQGMLLNPKNLDEAVKWSKYLDNIRNTYSPQSQLWLGETGNAMCGGQPGISDTFESSLWWADELGSMAASGQQLIVRQDLIGADYGLLEEKTYSPLPDYWISLLWKKLMGTNVLSVSTQNNPYIRTYAMCGNPKAGFPSGTVMLLAINLDKKNTVRINWQDSMKSLPAILYKINASSLDSKQIFINENIPKLNDYSFENIEAQGMPTCTNDLLLSPLSINYIAIPNAAPNACG